ncbi:hypothetical protein [Photobacterium sp. GSS17]|uniref:hypothetical protein n=1 Tax=Photobacterium sp. GSS17 TaxID=3020715 RepID=UPI0023622FDB|nr:hypothetical protein [Photobacterium sp. GSS17]
MIGDKMANGTTLEINGVKLAEVLGTAPHSATSGWYTTYSRLDKQIKRQVAVTAALELIRADVQAATARVGNSTATLQSHLDSLSEYADIIQKAMDTEEQK